MRTWTDQQIEDELSRHLSARLDPQVGRAAAYFEQSLAANKPARNRAAFLWTVGAGLVTATAAAIALAATLIPAPAARPHRPAVTPSAPPEVASVEPSEVVWWRSLDEGTVLLDDHTPARRVRRQILEQVQWYDPRRGTQVELTVPREEVLFVNMESY
jgi:hypothetical protein